MTRRTYWQLTVHYYPKAAAAGVPPVPVVPYTLTEEPGRYHPYTFDFDEPPSRADFLAVMAMLPYMQVHKDSLFPVIADSPFPVIELGMKAADQKLVKDGVQVGRLEVSKKDLWENDPKPTVHLPHDLIAKKVNRQPAELRDDLRRYLDEQVNSIREAMSNGKSASVALSDAVKAWGKRQKEGPG